jgi:hypothetical protein
MPSDASAQAGILYARAKKLSYVIEPSPDGKGYCLWRVWPGSGRQMVLGTSGGVTLDVIDCKLTVIEDGERAKKGLPPRT